MITVTLLTANINKTSNILMQKEIKLFLCAKELTAHF